MNYKFQKEDIPLFFCLVSIALLPFYIQGNSFLTILFGVSTLIVFFKRIQYKNFIKASFILPLLYFALLSVSSLKSLDIDTALNSLGRKSLIIILPFIFTIIGMEKIKWFKQIFGTFILSTFIALIVSFTVNAYKVLKGADISLLTHSNFADFIGLQSTYLALYMLISIFVLYYSFDYKLLNDNIFSKLVKKILITIFSFFIFLIATRILYIPLILFYSYVFSKQITNKLILLKTIIGLFLISVILFFIVTNVPLLKQRLSEIEQTDLTVLSLKKFEHDTPLNAITMRLLFSKLALEQLHENNTWLFGEGLGDIQNKLHDKFAEYNIYTGNPKNGDTGYLYYNYHNMYTQVIMQIGLCGLLIFLLFFFNGISKKNPLLTVSVLSYLFLFIAESALERQFGLSHIFFFYSLLINIDLSILKK